MSDDQTRIPVLRPCGECGEATPWQVLSSYGGRCTRCFGLYVRRQPGSERQVTPEQRRALARTIGQGGAA